MPPQLPSECGDPAKFNPQWRQSDNPIVDVSWEEARRYCQWAGNGRGDLPTEAQWEYAARGGTKDYAYPWGSELTHNDAHYGEPILVDNDPHKVKELRSREPKPRERDKWRYTAPVGSFPANGYGLFDMIGNVQEWCRDGFWPYPDANQVDPFVEPSSEEQRVVRGGSFVYGALDCRVWSRNRNPPGGHYADTGFRCVLPIQ